MPESSRHPHRLGLTIAAILAITSTGGSVYGWPAMRRILRREGTPACDAPPPMPPSAPSSPRLPPLRLETPTCDSQEQALSLVFTAGSWANQGVRLPVGILLDRLGPKRTSSASALLFACGSFIFAFATTTGGLAAGFFLIGVGGAGVQLSVQSVSSLWPRNKSLVMSALSGAFQAATIAYLAFELINAATGAARQLLLIAHACAALLAALAALAVFPWVSFGVAAKPQPPAAAATAAQPTATVDVELTPAVTDEPEAPAVTAAPSAAAPEKSAEAAGVERHAAAAAEAKGAAPAPAPPAPGALPLKQRDYRGQARSPEYLLLLPG